MQNQSFGISINQHFACSIFPIKFETSVTRWHDTFFNIWPRATMNACPTALKFGEIL